MIHARRVGVTHTVVDKLRYKRNHGCPASYKEQRQHHFWCNTAVDAEEDRPFRMVIEVARANLISVSDYTSRYQQRHTK